MGAATRRLNNVDKKIGSAGKDHVRWEIIEHLSVVEDESQKYARGVWLGNNGLSIRGRLDWRQDESLGVRFSYKRPSESYSRGKDRFHGLACFGTCADGSVGGTLRAQRNVRAAHKSVRAT
jgi:hypothetical protein